MYNSYYTTSYDSLRGLNSSNALMAVGATLIILWVIGILIGIGFYIYSAITLGKIFKKAGQPSWAAWVPFYNSWVFLEIGELPGALIFLSLIPGLGALALVVLTQVAAYRIGLKLGKSGEFVLLSIFLYPVWLGILAFGKSQWVGQVTPTATTPTIPTE